MKSALIFASTSVFFVFIRVSCEYVADTVANLEDNAGSSQVGTGRRGDIVNMEDMEEQLIVNIDSGDVLGFDSSAGGTKGGEGGGGGRKGGGRGGGGSSGSWNDAGQSEGNQWGDESYEDGGNHKGGPGPGNPAGGPKGNKGSWNPEGKSQGGKQYHGRGVGGKGRPAGGLDCDAINAECHCNQINRQRPQRNGPDGPDDYPIDYQDGAVKGVKG